MTTNPKLDELAGRALAPDLRERLKAAVETGKINEEVARMLGIQTRAEDPPTVETPTEQPAELSDAEADRIVDKLWQRFETRFDAKTAEQATAATKAQEPIQNDLTQLKASVDGLTSVFKQLLGEQPAAHQHYRASNDAATVINKGGDDPETAAMQAALAEAERVRKFVMNGGAQ